MSSAQNLYEHLHVFNCTSKYLKNDFIKWTLNVKESNLDIFDYFKDMYKVYVFPLSNVEIFINVKIQ